MNTQHFSEEQLSSCREQYEKCRRRYGISHLLAGLSTTTLGIVAFEAPALLRLSSLLPELGASTILVSMAGGIGLLAVGLIWLNEGWYGGFGDMLDEWFD